MKDFAKTSLRNPAAEFVALLFLILTGWWIALHFMIQNASTEALQLWAAIYQSIALCGALIGFTTARQWGGVKSILGRAIVAFSLGLLFQSFGQSMYSFYIYYLHIPVPYPSLGDIGFWGSIPCYIYGAFLLARASGAHISLKSFGNRIQTIIIPLALLAVSYFMFLSGYDFDWSNPIKIFLDFGYPIGQALYVSVAVLAFSLSLKTLGGVMRMPLLFFIFALVFQYLSDFMFLYQASHETWYAGGLNDLMYATSYTIMALSLVYIGDVFHKIKSS